MLNELERHLASVPNSALVSAASFEHYKTQFLEGRVATALQGSALDGQRDVQRQIAAHVQAVPQVLNAEALHLLQEENRKLQVKQFAAINVSELAKPLALQGESCFTSFKELKEIGGFKDYMAPSEFVGRNDGRFEGYVENPFGLTHVEHDLPAALQDSTYLPLLKTALEEKGFIVELKQINDWEEWQVIEDPEDVNEGKRELPVGIHLTW